MSWFDLNRHRYPPNWKEIAIAIKEAADWTCEVCNVPHGPVPAILTVHHINHEPSDCDPPNLLACCQRCHLKCQALRPRPTSKEEAITRLRDRADRERSQLALEIEA